MILGRVVGELWSTVKSRRLSGRKILLVQPSGWYEPSHDTDLIAAVDNVDAGTGDEVVVSMGAPSRYMSGGLNLPFDSAIVAVVDKVEANTNLFEKGY